MRIEYSAPTQIVFVIKGSNAMYYNLDLQEVEYFNPKNTVAKIFFDFFYDKKFLEGIKFNNENNSFNFVKKIKIKDEINNIKIIFEKSPIKLRKIEMEKYNNNDSSINIQMLFMILIKQDSQLLIVGQNLLMIN